MTDPIRYMEVTLRGICTDTLGRSRAYADTSVWTYTNPATLEHDLRAMFGDTLYASLGQERIHPKDAYRAEHWGGEGHRFWLANVKNERTACMLGPYVFPDMSPQKV